MRRFLLILAVLGATGCALAPAANAVSTDTTVRTIQDRDGDNLLEFAPGEDYCRYDPVTDQCTTVNRPPSLTSLLTFAQLSDFQTLDEESPARAEWLDFTQRGPVNAFAAAYRPQDTLSTQVNEAMIRQMRNWVSRVTNRKAQLTIVTGDNADNQHFDETRWFIDELDGTGAVRPPGFTDTIDPNSGKPTAACDATPGSIYDGVRDNGRHRQPDDGYYEPDSSAEPRHDGDGYTPNRSENQEEVERDVTVRDFPKLFEFANQPFEALGAGMPWYSAFGNHDALVQGNEPFAYVGPVGTSGETPNAVIQAVATGCVKVLQPAAATLTTVRTLEQQIQDLQDGDFTFDDFEEAIAKAGEVNQQVQDTLTSACTPGTPIPDCTNVSPAFGGTADIVPPDERRCFLAKDRFAGSPAPPGPDPALPCDKTSWIDEHFATTGTPVGHGFAPAVVLSPTRQQQCAEDPSPADCVQASYGRPPAALANHDGYYSFSPRAGLRFVVLDTITDECASGFCAEGTVDDAQYQWLREQIETAEKLDQYVMVFSHHSLRTTRQPDNTDVTEQPVHFGERVDHRSGQPEPVSTDTLEDLYCKHRNVIANVAGHEHENYVLHHHCDDTEGATSDFWEVVTASHMDWPQQMRMIEVVNDGGQLALALTILDHSGDPNPGNAQPCPSPEPPVDDPRCEVALGQSGYEPLKLASVSRELSYNDYQASRGARGGTSDHNVIIPLGRPAS